jgi:hypothetical protein
MSSDRLGVYLNDHLAGATAALEILRELEDPAMSAGWASRIKAEIAEDRQVLERTMSNAGIAISKIRQHAARLSEKAAELKMRFDDRAAGALKRLELIEALAIGIDGKRALWMALQAAGPRVPALAGVDYQHLIARADQQRQEVEKHRIRAALEAFG